MGLLGKGKRDTNSIGDISESAIITRFLQLGYVVLTPYGGNQRYDLVILNKVYLIPVDQVGTTRANLRIGPPKNNQEKHVRWAQEYEL